MINNISIIAACPTLGRRPHINETKYIRSLGRLKLAAVWAIVAAHRPDPTKDCHIDLYCTGTIYR